MIETKEMTGAQVAELLNRAIPGAQFCASHWGCLWAFGPFTHDRNDFGEMVVSTESFGVWARWDSRQKKISVSGHVPRWAGSHISSHNNPPRLESINVNPGRPIEAIGKDIERRFLAPWRECYPHLHNLAVKRRDAVTARDDAMGTVAKSLGWGTPTNGSSDRLRGSDGIYDVYFGSDCRIGSFDVRADLTPEAFVAVVKLIQELRTDK